jgi:hypothetical protein
VIRLEIVYKLIGYNDERKEATATELYGACLKLQKENKGKNQYELDLKHLPEYVKDEFYLSKCSSFRISSDEETIILPVNSISKILRDRDNRFVNKERMVHKNSILEEMLLQNTGGN